MRYLSLLLLIALVGCTTVPVSETVVIPPFKSPLPSAIRLRSIEFKAVVTTNDTYLALDAHNYENLTRNFEDMSTYIESLRVIIYSYETNNFAQQTSKTNTPPKEIKKKSWLGKLFEK